MLTLLRTDTGNEAFKSLIVLLDQGLVERNGDQQSWYDKYNVVKSIPTAIVAKWDIHPVGCGCFKPFDQSTVEMKRMFVMPEKRGHGIATGILTEMESWAASLGYSRAILETGRKQLEAINLYKKSGYAQIENFGQYAGIGHSLCFAKPLKQKS